MTALPTRRLRAIGLAIIAALLTVMFGSAFAAHAATGNIDFTQRGSITVHKFDQPDVNGPVATGAIMPTDGLAPIAGVTFTATQVVATTSGTDLTNSPTGLQDPRVWDQIANLTPSTVVAKAAPTGPYTATTDEQGVAAFPNLPVGIYLVQETAQPTGVIPAQPFLVSIPTDVSGTWTYDVHAYPKNQVTGVTKMLDPNADADAYGQGDEVIWNIAGTIPSGAQNPVTGVTHTDTLDASLDYVRIQSVRWNGQELATTDYTATSAGKTVTVKLTAAGLAKTTTRGNLTYQLVTKVNDSAVTAMSTTGVAVIPNQVKQLINTADGKSATTVSEKPIANWGRIQLTKLDKDNQLPLQGAEFQIFRTEADAAAKTNPITVDKQATFTTDQNGTLEISALNAGEIGSRDYWIVETKAPAGYIDNPTPIQVTVKATADGQSTAPVTVENTKQTLFTLPITGGISQAILVVLGAGVLALAAGIVIRNAKREAKA